MACTVALLAAGCRAGSPASPAETATTTTAPATTSAAAGYQPAVTLGRIDDPNVDESSGLVASRRNPGLYWTHNDSGDGPFLYCVDSQAHGCGVWQVTGAAAFDWEDIAAGPGPVPGAPYLYVGDIGDNIDQRTEIVVYRVPDPTVNRGLPVPTKAAPAATARAEELRLRYPDGARNAEALLIHPVTGDLYVVSKEPQGANVYKAAAPVDPSKLTTLIKVATVQLGSGLAGPELVTGGDISPDGRRVALCTYTRAYEYQVAGGQGPFDAVWSTTPTPLALGFRPQGEAIAYRLDGRALLTTSEIYPSALQQVEYR